MIKLLDKIVLLISILAIVGLTGAYLAPYINPNSFVIPSLLGLAYPYWLIANIVLLLYWTARWQKKALVLLAVILLGIPTFMTYYGTNKEEEHSPGHNLELMSYNVRYFDMYKWSKKKDTREKLFDFLGAYKGDIVCLQEFPSNNTVISLLEIIRNLVSYRYRYINKDMAIFSRLPIIKSGRIEFDKKYSSSCIWCDIKLPGDTIRVYSIHLESYRFGKEDRKAVQNMTTNGAKNIANKLITANKNRALQAEQIKRHTLKSPYKVIICGDFNDTPLSYTYREIRDGLNDSFIDKGRGLGNTYIGEFPSFRIDYILHSPEIETLSYTRNNIVLSDHYPITCKLKTKGEK